MSLRARTVGTTACQRGFALVTAIFLLVVLAGLGAAIVSVSTMQHVGSALDVQGASAYQAARAGVEWGVYRQLRNGVCNSAQASFVPTAPLLNVFTVTVTCTPTTYSGATPNITVYQVQSTACNQPSAGSCPGTGGGMNYVERQLRVSF